MDENEQKQGLFGKLKNILLNNPETIDDLKLFLSSLKESEVISEDILYLLYRVLDFSKLEVRDVMLSRSKMDVIKITDNIVDIVEKINETSHSRFPVVGEDKDEVLGILHSKDLFKYFFNQEGFDLSSLLRPTVFTTEGNLLSSLVKEFRDKHLHLAVVVDEYGGVSGIITFEDIIEQIIGEIEDEFDIQDKNIVQVNANVYKVSALTELEEFNQFFHTDFSHEDVDTIGGLIVSKLERVPEKNEEIILDNFKFLVISSDLRKINSLIVTNEVK